LIGIINHINVMQGSRRSYRVVLDVLFFTGHDCVADHVHVAAEDME
jgi:hypothetical protein